MKPRDKLEGYMSWYR